MMSQMERDHNDRAERLRATFETPEKFADFLHQQHRAAAKALEISTRHDHGYSECYGHGKRYFLRRAKWLMSPIKHWNGRGCQGEQACGQDGRAARVLNPVARGAGRHRREPCGCTDGSG